MNITEIFSNFECNLFHGTLFSEGTQSNPILRHSVNLRAVVDRFVLVNGTDLLSIELENEKQQVFASGSEAEVVGLLNNFFCQKGKSSPPFLF